MEREKVKKKIIINVSGRKWKERDHIWRQKII
jgi:hypothetical protein